MQLFGMTRRGVIALSFGWILGAASQARAESDASVIAPIQRLVEELLQIMHAGKATPFAKRFAMLAPVIDQTFDLATILRNSVGPDWASMSPDQKEKLMSAFRRYTIAAYVNSFDSFHGQQFKVSNTTRAVGDEQIVQTTIIPKTGPSHELDYVMKRTQANWQVVDVLADGAISRVAVQRSDFRRLIDRGGAEALAESLRSKSNDLEGAAS